jgi:hypothetical protein
MKNYLDSLKKINIPNEILDPGILGIFPGIILFLLINFEETNILLTKLILILIFPLGYFVYEYFFKHNLQKFKQEIVLKFASYLVGIITGISITALAFVFIQILMAVYQGVLMLLPLITAIFTLWKEILIGLFSLAILFLVYHKLKNKKWMEKLSKIQKFSLAAFIFLFILFLIKELIIPLTLKIPPEVLVIAGALTAIFGSSWFLSSTFSQEVEKRPEEKFAKDTQGKLKAVDTEKYFDKIINKFKKERSKK